MDIAINILWIILLVVMVWLVVEIVLTVRKTRSKLDGIATSVEETVDQANEAIKALQPAVKEVQPLLSKAQTTVDALSLDLLHVNEILGDVETVSGAASKATGAVTGAVEKAGHAITGAVDKITGRAQKEAKKLAEVGEAKALQGEQEVVDTETVTQDAGYFTYPSGETNDILEDKQGDKVSNTLSSKGNSEND